MDSYTEQLDFAKDGIVETGSIHEEKKMLDLVTNYYRDLIIAELNIGMPWSENPIEDLANIHIRWRILDKDILTNFPATAFDFSFKDAHPEIIGKVVKEGNKMLMYRYKLNQKIFLPVGLTNYFEFTLGKPMKFIFGVRGTQRRPV